MKVIKVIYLIVLFWGMTKISAKNTAISERDYLFLSTDYITNTNTFGVFVSEAKQPNFTPSLTYLSKYNFDLSFSSFIVGNSDTSFSETTYEFDFMAGYTFNIKEKFCIYPSYTHIEYSKNSYTLRSVFTDIAQLDFSAYFKWYYAGLTTSYMFGSKNMFYISLQNSVELNIDNFLFKNSLLSIQLGADLNFSDRNLYNEIIYYEWNAKDFLYWINTQFSSRAAYYVSRQIILYGLESSKTYVFNYLDEFNKSLFGRDYNISSVDVLLPIYYSVDNFMFNLTLMAVFPTYSNSFFESSPQMLFSTGVSYTFGL